MTLITRSELLNFHESDTATDRSQAASGKLRYPPSPPPTIQQRIYDAMREYPDQWFTRADIAESLGLRKTKWLTDAIESLVFDGYLVREESLSHKRSFMFLYALNR